MQLTAAVINAGLGDLTLGLQMSGFQVVAAFEDEEKAARIHKRNLDVPLYPFLSERIDVIDFPYVDLLAAHLYHPRFSYATSAKREWHDGYLYRLREILYTSKPRAFFLLVNAASLKDKQFQGFLDDVTGYEYNLVREMIDVAQMTGIPVRENAACVVGISKSIDHRFEFPSPNKLPLISLSRFISQDLPVDPWHYNVRLDREPIYEDWHQVLCWRNCTYEGTDFVRWNYMQLPLVRCADGFRKITHREVANLKGFPGDYDLPCNDKRWLYKKLIYSSNLIVIQQIAGMINYTLTSNPWRTQRKTRGSRFEQIFGKYLETLIDKGLATCVTNEQFVEVANTKPDYILSQGDSTFYFEVKYALTSKTKRVLERLGELKETGIPIMVVADELSAEEKKAYFEQYGAHIWDVSNLLWLFEEYPDIKNEFIAFLECSTDDISPEAPDIGMIQPPPASEPAELDLKERLLKITPGHARFREYESTCTEILKFVLGDYLTLWEEQETSNDGLYRFDLCCKIKNGANQDFFDTIKHYFNTKYIVFEFKNYKDKITQEEIYTTEKYLYEKALRKVAIVISRFGADDHALKAAKGTLRENGKLIICLSDNSLLEMIDIKMRGDQEPAEFLGAILDDILVHLEK